MTTRTSICKRHGKPIDPESGNGQYLHGSGYCQICNVGHEEEEMECTRTAHTPGPWHWTTEYSKETPEGSLDGSYLTNSDGIVIVPRRWDGGCGYTAVENEGDRCLIAAAPELLEALKDATEAISYMHEWIDEEVSRAVTPKNENIEQLVERLEKAIQKAEGRAL